MGLQEIQKIEVYLFVNFLLGKQIMHCLVCHMHGSPIPVQ